jgi:hypothetical protein
MTASNHSRNNADTVAAAILSTTGAMLLFGQLDIVSSRLHLSLLPSWIEWWPLLLVGSGTVLLLTHQAKLRSLKRQARSTFIEQGDKQ